MYFGSHFSKKTKQNKTQQQQKSQNGEFSYDSSNQTQ